MTTADIIRHLHLTPHPEGGHYRETYRSGHTLGPAGPDARHVSTAIYYLLAGQDKSHFHRIKSDELWFFHQGQPLDIILLLQGQPPTTVTLGTDLAAGQVPQAIIPANTWFAARLPHGTGHALVSCTVAPGFDFADFELATREELTAEFPHLTELIGELTLG
ncbi:cupin domain-containing protein [Hymenobacter busanensis]|uniref:Cupin domain-containing protein n=1 Tax=Hymenobacter busanensis TaxID=2607656 RepID=A0A7L4ZV30_9BACT|nr:cupin domain-containing protein [Hymenobacter busanensis]KAA9332334.1 cupin domain-containing protein [Hymenobacter busanensis]QHJ07329.1 cupin domain-containing protein [Hymenobacter busanensis]